MDGARFLRSVGAGARLCGLVTNHSGAAHEARLRGLAAELAGFFDERSLARDGLWYCDMTTGPDGRAMTFTERLAEIQQRYGDGHVVPQAIGAAAVEIQAAIDRVLSQASALRLVAR